MIKEAIGNLVSGNSLTLEEASSVMEEIMEGTATQAQLGAFLSKHLLPFLGLLEIIMVLQVETYCLLERR